MFNFHKHNWKEIARTFQPSNLQMAKDCGLTEMSIWSDSYKNYTTILWECEICQKLRKQEMLGEIIK